MTSKTIVAMGFGASIWLMAGDGAIAGAKHAWPVIFSRASDGSGHGEGALGTARASSDDNLRISCNVVSYRWGGEYGFCSGNDAAGAGYMCWTQQPSLLNAIRSIGSDSYLYFVWNAASECDLVSVTTDSADAPRQP
jgi:hypothetical protein